MKIVPEISWPHQKKAGEGGKSGVDAHRLRHLYRLSSGPLELVDRSQDDPNISVPIHEFPQQVILLRTQLCEGVTIERQG